MTHLMNSQYTAISASVTRLLSHRTPIIATPMAITSAPKYQGTRVIALPAKRRLGRPGTCTQEMNHFIYQTSAHGAGRMKRKPTKRARLRQTNSRISKSIDNGPPPYWPAEIGALATAIWPPGGGAGGGREAAPGA